MNAIKVTKRKDSRFKVIMRSRKLTVFKGDLYI